MTKKEWYEKRKAAGLCVQCGKRPAMKGNLKCAECRAKHRKLLARQRQALMGCKPGYGCLTCPFPRCRMANSHSSKIYPEELAMKKASGNDRLAVAQLHAMRDWHKANPGRRAMV